MGKGQIARYEQFLLFPQFFFQKDCLPGAPKGVIVWEWVNPASCTDRENLIREKEMHGDLKTEQKKVQ